MESEICLDTVAYNLDKKSDEQRKGPETLETEALIARTTAQAQSKAAHF